MFLIVKPIFFVTFLTFSNREIVIIRTSCFNVKKIRSFTSPYSFGIDFFFSCTFVVVHSPSKLILNRCKIIIFINFKKTNLNLEILKVKKILLRINYFPVNNDENISTKPSITLIKLIFPLLFSSYHL